MDQSSWGIGTKTCRIWTLWVMESQQEVPYIGCVIWKSHFASKESQAPKGLGQGKDGE